MSITAACVLVFATLYWLLRSRSEQRPARKLKTHTKTQSAPKVKSPYRATSINARGCGCAATAALGKTRFLCSANIPKLPLAECTSQSCQCVYVRHDDRRSSQEDRRAIYSMQTDLHGAQGEVQRRAKRGRRESDRTAGATADLDYTEFKWTT